MSKTTKTTVGEVKVTESNVTKFADIFDIVKHQGNFFIGVAGKLVSAKSFATKEEAEQFIAEKPWELIINVSCLMYDLSKKTK